MVPPSTFLWTFCAISGNKTGKTMNKSTDVKVGLAVPKIVLSLLLNNSNVLDKKRSVRLPWLSRRVQPRKGSLTLEQIISRWRSAWGTRFATRTTGVSEIKYPALKTRVRRRPEYHINLQETRRQTERFGVSLPMWKAFKRPSSWKTPKSRNGCRSGAMIPWRFCNSSDVLGGMHCKHIGSDP